MWAKVYERSFVNVAEIYERPFVNVRRRLRTHVRKTPEYAAVYAVDIRCTYMKCVVWTHRNVICAHSYKSLEQSLEHAAKKSSGVGGRPLSTALRRFKIPRMLFKKRIPAAYLNLTICHSIHAKHVWRYVWNMYGMDATYCKY